MSQLDIIRTCLFTPGSRGWGLPILIWGMPGEGKTDIIEAIGRKFQFVTEVLSPGERGEGAFGVTPMPYEKLRGKKQVPVIGYPEPDWTGNFYDEDGDPIPGMIFVDEMSTAAPALQPPLLGLLQARRIGGAHLHSQVRVIGAANPPEMAAGGWELSPPVANRVGHLDWDESTFEEWVNWLLSYDPTQKPKVDVVKNEEERVIKLWPEAWGDARGAISAFMRARPELLRQRPKPNDPQGSRAWASPRTWDMAVRADAAASCQNLSDDDRIKLIASFVGTGPATELAAFRSTHKLPKAADVLDGRVKWSHDATRLDQSMAVLSACAALLSTSPDSDERSRRNEMMWKLIANVASDAHDIAIFSIRPLVKARLHATKPAVPVMSKLKPVLDEAGVAI